jgi:hypothetical protein
MGGLRIALLGHSSMFGAVPRLIGVVLPQRGYLRLFRGLPLASCQARWAVVQLGDLR